MTTADQNEAIRETVTAEDVSALLKRKSKHSIIVMVLSAIFIFALFFLIQGTAISYQLQSLNLARLESAKSAFQQSTEQEDQSRAQFDRQYSARLQMMAYMYDHTPNAASAWKSLSQNDEYKDVCTVLLLNSTGSSFDSIANAENLAITDIEPVKSVLSCASYSYIDPVTITSRSGSSVRLFAEKLSNGVSLIIGVRTDDLETIVDRTASISRTLSGLNNGDAGYVAAVDIATQKVLYDVFADNIGKDALDCGFSEGSLKDGYRGFIVRKGEIATANTSVQTRSDKISTANTMVENGVALVSLTPVDNFSKNHALEITYITIAFMAICGLIISLGMILRNDYLMKFEMPKFVRFGRSRNRKTGKKEQNYLNMTLLRKMMPVILAGVLIVYIVSLFLQTTFLISDASSETSKVLAEIQEILDDNEETRQFIKTTEENQYISKAEVISQMLMDNPDWIFSNNIYGENVHEVPVTVNAEGKQTGLDAYGHVLHSCADNQNLKWLVNINGLNDIYVFDENGRVVSTSSDFWNFALSENENDQSYPFWQILNGTKMNYAQDAEYDEVGGYSQYTGTTYYYYTYQDEGGETRYTNLAAYESQSSPSYQGPVIDRHLGLVQIALNPEEYSSVLKTTDIKYVFSNYHISYNGFLTVFDKSEDPVLVYSPKATSIGKTISQLGGNDKEIFNHTGGINNAIMTINGVRYYQGFGEISDYYIGTAISTAALFSVRDTVSFSLLLISLAAFMILLITIAHTSTDEYSMYAQAIHQREAFRGSDDETYMLPHSTEMLKQRDLIFRRLNPGEENWSDKTPSQKFAVLLRIYAMVLAVILFADILLSRAHLISMPMDDFVMNSNWSRNFNFITATRSAVFLFLTIVGANLLSQVILMMCKPLGSRITTIGRLSASVLKYGIVLFAIFYGLYIIGLNASNLLTSAGIISVVVGLGAQSVIGDILSGIFIVFEGEFHVGDIVTVDGFTGTVMDVGIRTTKIRDGDGNIKIFDNSDISGVLNLSENPSTALVSIPIDHDEDIDKIEELFRREALTLRQKNRDIINDASYVGVTNLDRFTVELTIAAPCYERKKFEVTKFVRRDLYKMLKENGVVWTNDR